jgi:hypothetical protein
MDSTLINDAKQAVNECKLSDYINDHDLTIYKKLINCYLDAATGTEVDRLVFIGDSLEVANHIVHLGTSRQTYYDGIEWVKQKWPDADPREVLAALVLIYLIISAESGKGAKVLREAGNEVNALLKGEEKHVKAEDVWMRLREIVEAVLNTQSLQG